MLFAELWNELQLDRSSPVPIYHQVAETIKRLILSGALPPGQRLPSETELSSALHISPMTARQALTSLEAAGLIRRKRGIGSFVLARRFDRPLDHLVGFTQDMAARGVVSTSRILRFEPSTAPVEAVERGLIEAGMPMLRIKRLRFANDQPSALQDAYFSGVDFTREALEETGSIYGLLRTQGIAFEDGGETIDAVVASSEEATLLHVPENAPLLRTTLFARDEAGWLREFTLALYRADLYQFRAHLSRWLS